MELTAIALQTVAENQNILFTETPVSGNCSILHREGSGLVTLRGIGAQCRARFKIFFSGNIGVPATGTAGAISVALTLDGEAVASSSMISTPAAVSEFNNVASAVYVNVPQGCCLTVSVRNTSDQAIEVQNANLIIERVA